MLTAIRVGNFKAFAETQRIPLRPLTLIYGANSSGKSTIIHSLLLARHALETGELDVHRTAIGGDSVDLGGFRQYIHRRDVGLRMEWSAELETAPFTGRLAELLAAVKRLSVSIAAGIALDDQGRPLPEALPEIHSYEILGDERSLIRMSKRQDGNLHLDRLDHEHPVFRGVVKAIVETSTTTEGLEPSDYEGVDEAINGVVSEIIASVTTLLPEGLAKTHVFNPGGQLSFFPVSKGRRKEDLAAAVQFFIPRTLDELLRGIGATIRAELSGVHYLGPLRSYPPRHLAFSQHHDPNWFAGGGYAWDVVRRDASVREQLNAWLTAPDRLQTPYELVLRYLVGEDQLNAPLLEGLDKLRETGVEMEHENIMDTMGRPWPFIEDPETGEFVKFKGIALELDPELETERLLRLIQVAQIDKLRELIMVDRRSNTIVSHRDVGIGVSQVLPVLVGAFASRNQIIAIEQPEIHLHPALQADLGDVFIESALGQNKNRFLIETHSEHLLLRIMRRMRETSERRLPEGSSPVSPDDVMVLFVEPDGSKSIIREMPLNDRGELVKAWPGGFFEEGLREVF